MPAVRADGFEAVAMLKPIIADRAPPPKGLAPLAVPLNVERHREWCFRSDAPKSSGNTIRLRRQTALVSRQFSPARAGLWRRFHAGNRHIVPLSPNPGVAGSRSCRPCPARTLGNPFLIGSLGFTSIRSLIRSSPLNYEGTLRPFCLWVLTPRATPDRARRFALGTLEARLRRGRSARRLPGSPRA
jgi:hypothetical protein